MDTAVIDTERVQTLEQCNVLQMRRQATFASVATPIRAPTLEGPGSPEQTSGRSAYGHARGHPRSGHRHPSRSCLASQAGGLKPASDSLHCALGVVPQQRRRFTLI